MKLPLLIPFSIMAFVTRLCLLALLVASVSAQTIIDADNYQIKITNPGFRMEVSTPAGTVLPADPTTGLSFHGSPALSSVQLSRDEDVTRFRVTNGAGKTALVVVETKPHTVELTVTTEAGQPGIISMRTGSPGPAYGLGDQGGWQSNANLASSQKTYPIKHNGAAYRWISSFLVFPKSGVAGACFERQDGEVSIGPSYYQMSNKSTASQKFYYFIGSMHEIYAAWREARIAEGFPGVTPKMDAFELGFETWDLLKWHTNADTCRNAIQTFLDHGYPIRWAVTGSGFWQAQGTTVSFGLYDFTKYPETRTPLPPDFGDWCKASGIRWMIGQRTNFVPPGGPYSSNPGQSGATLFDTSPHSQAALDLGYFLKDATGKHIKVKSNVFPTVPCYLLDGNVPGAAAWFKARYDAWGVDGIKEDTMMAVPDHTIFNAPILAIAQGGDLVMARCGAYSSPGTLTRINDTKLSDMTLRCPINYLQYAASGAPNVYSDTVGFGGMSDVTTTMRHAWLLALTAGMAVSDSPWNRNWSAADGAKLKKAIDFHYQIGPYLHSCALDSHTSGYPHTMTPLPIAFPDDANTYNLASSSARQFQWMIGPSLLAAPLLHRNYAKSSKMNIYLPEGKWIDFETGTAYTGPQTLAKFDMPLDKVPVFVGGKGVLVSRPAETSALAAIVYPIAIGGSTYDFTHPDGISTSAIINNNTGWNPATLKVTNTTAASPVPFTTDPITRAIRFEILPGIDYELSQGD
jgi:alpha-glucosidase (family GH31 glycosyl hydrolase)